MKKLRLFAALFVAFGPLFLVTPAHAASVGMVSITCEKDSVQGTYEVSWDNSNIYFADKGSIPQFYCEGGHSPLGAGATYTSDTLTDDTLRYYNGVVPTPVEPTPEPSPTQTLEPQPSPKPTPEPVAPSWEYSVNEGETLIATAPTGQVFSGAVAMYVSHDTSCGLDVSELVAAEFNGKESASIDANNSVFGDPCPGQYKKLTVNFMYETLVPVPEVTPEVPPTLEVPQVVEPVPTAAPAPEPAPEPEPIPSPTSEPAPEPIPTETLAPVVVPEPAPPVVLPNLGPVLEVKVEPKPEPKPEPAPLPEQPPKPTPLEENKALIQELTTIAPKDLTDAQVEVLVAAALETFETTEQGSPEYAQALEALAVAANADDPELPQELLALPLVGEALGAALEVFNDLGNMGSDMAPAVREDAEKVVISAVIVTQVITSAAVSAAVTSAAATSTRKIS